MKIGHVVLHSCVRAHKEAWILLENGHEVFLATERPMHNFGWRDYSSCNLVWTGHLDGYQPDRSQFASTIQMMSSHVDLFHVHNEPDWIVKVVKDNTDKPVVYDVHDMVSQRMGAIDLWEREAMDACDAIVVPSGKYKQILQRRVPLKPIVEILSCVPMKLMPTVRRKPERLGIVYEGGLKGKPKERSDQFEFRSWKDVFLQISMMNIGVWAYPSSAEEDYSEYKGSGIIVMPTLRYDELLKNLTAHEAGLVGSPVPNGAFDGALPNKMFEYIAAGIPVIAYNAPDAEAFLVSTGFGVGVKDVTEIPEVLDRFHEEKTRDYVWEMRKHWAMETQAQKLITLYNQLLGKPRHEAFEQISPSLADA